MATTTKAAIDWKDRVANYVETHGPALLSAILILAAGFFVARWLGEVAKRWLSRKELQLEPPVQMLFARLLRLLVMVFALVTAAGTAGMNVTALVASVGVAGVGVGLATQGVLSNIVAGLTIIFTKPFRVGEYIEMLGTHGQVTAIELSSTTLLHSDRSRVVIPNRKSSAKSSTTTGPSVSSICRLESLTIRISTRRSLPCAIFLAAILAS